MSPEPPRQHWFVAILLYESSIEGANDVEPSTEVSYRLIRASDVDGAYRRAVELGHQEQTSYLNSDGETCTWRFLGLEDLQEVSDETLEDGTEVYGFIEKGPASRRVVPMDKLTAFVGRPLRA